MRWFHGTSKQNAEKILKEGVLKPGQDTVYDIDIPRHNAVYIADWDVAHQYALERGGVILEVATPNPKKLIPDEDDVYELLSDHKGHLNTQGQGLQQRIQTLWLQKWNEENAAYRTEYSEEQFPNYESFEQAWEAWGEIEFEGSAELAEQMKELTDYIVKKDPALAQAVIQMSGKAAHLGPIKVVGKAPKQAAKKPEYVKTLGVVIEVPQERRKTFWTRPVGKLEYWAFKNRPRAFVSEPIIFTFDRKPVAQAVVLRVEAPGSGEGEYKHWHKIYWNPSTFVKYRSITASAKKAGWVGPVYHGSYAGFSGNPKGDPEAAGLTWFTDSAEYAGYFSSQHGQYQPNSAIYPAYIRLGKPFDARNWSEEKVSIEEYARAIGATKAALLNEIPTLPTETWFWRYLLMTPHTSKKALQKQGYDSIIQLEAEDRGQTPHTTSFVVFNNTQIKSLTGQKPPKKVLDLTGKEAAAKELYHVTLQKNLDDILEQGLKAEHGYQFFDDIPKATYLTEKQGLPFWKDEIASYYGDPQVVLKVNTQGLNLIPDEFGTNDAGAPAFRVEQDIPPSHIKLAMKTADHINDEGFWAGEGNAASGVLPVCPTTGNVCLAMRSSEVLTPNCWGTIGGAVQRGMSPQESAKTEMQEETGYHGGINLIPAFVFAAAGGFKYHNFIGVVSAEFAFHPSEEHSWETDFIQWLPYADVVRDMQKNPGDYHPGLIALFKNSRKKIEMALGLDKEVDPKTGAQKNPALTAFMQDLWAQTKGNPFNNAERVYQNKSIIEARPFDGRIHLSFIRSVEQGKGWGTEGLKFLTDLADKHGVEIDLDADPPHGMEVLSQSQLISWYKRHGFRRRRGEDHEPNALIYSPKGVETTLKLGPNMKTIPMDKTSSHSPACRCEMCRSIEQWRRPWLTGKCHEFALALSTQMPDAQFVAIGNAMLDHVGLRSGNTYYDVRGAMTKQQFAELFGSNENSVHDVTREQVMKDAYPSYIGHEDELAGLPEMKQALKAVRRALHKNKTAGLQFQDTNRGYHSDQSDQTLTALMNGKPVGYMEYSVYQDEPSVQWLEVFDKRKGYGTALLKELQRMYPNVEVDLGMLTDEGGKLIDSVKFNEQPSEYAAKFDELEKLVQERDKLQQVADEYYARENHTEEEKQGFMRQMENMNNIHDRIWELEQETSNKRRTKRYIAAEQQHLFPDSQDANFQAWFKGSKVVDKDGRPQPVYHGTRSSVDFDTFSVDGPPVDDSDYEGQPMSSGSGADPTAMMGAHFAVQPEVASQFATPARGRWQSTRYEGENEMPRVIQVFLRITNPKDFGSEHNLREFINQGKVSGDALDIAMQGEGINPLEDEEAASEWYNRYESDQAFRTEQNRYLFEQAPGGEGYDDDLRDAAYELAAQARQRLETAGHDGIHYKNVVEGGTAWIIFDPRQAKSVWAQSFNPIDPRFTASVESDAAEIKVVPKSKGLEAEAWYEGQRVGFVYLHKMEDAPGNPRAPKNSLMVDAAALAEHLKGKSIGLKMYRAGIEAARKAGFERVYEGIEHSEDAANLWERLKQLYPTEFDEDWGIYYIPLKQVMGATASKIATSKATVLYLDDTRKPLRPGVAWVRNYDEFVQWLSNNDMPDVVSLDHDLALEHYPASLEEDRERNTSGIPYDTYTEPTGLDAAKYIVKNKLPLKNWAVHSANPVGRYNIRQVLHAYRPDGEVFPNIPFTSIEKAVYGDQVVNGYRVEPWVKKAAGFAFRSFKKLWHVGTMNPNDKQKGSYEGAGLSVSVNPEEWQYIAGVGGDLWELTKQGNRFLNFHRIGKTQRQQIVQWGLKKGYVEPVVTYKVEFWDDEDQETRYHEYLDKAEADAEAKSMIEEEGNESVKVVTDTEALNPTPTLLQRAHADRSEPTMAWDYLVIVYAEDMLQCDGVWWDDRLDQYALSAPRGVIFKDKLSSWKIKKVQRAAGAPKPTATQLTALGGMMSGDGTIHRERGGFWVWRPIKEYDKFGVPIWEGEKSAWVDIRTVRAMEKRGWVERTNTFPEEWRDVRRLTDAGQLLLMSSKISADHSWSREQAEDFLRQLPLAEAGYVGKVIGGVAATGRSSHDLDILLIPTTQEFDFEKVMNYFQSVGADQQPTHNGEEEIWEVRLPSGQVVDFFFSEESKTASTDEPGLLFRAPEDNTAHDYQPSWDYMVQTHPDPELAALASEAAKRIYQRTKQPFECWACELPAGAVAMYINGTCGYPVVLLDLEMHRDHTDQFYKSIDHELKHAVQEREGRDFDEDEAEDDLSEIPVN
jgi:8-oxo-dGTP pyrophosphatase MutT (NUDIX family)